jgi:hypothetical protein
MMVDEKNVDLAQERRIQFGNNASKSECVWDAVGYQPGCDVG